MPALLFRRDLEPFPDPPETREVEEALQSMSVLSSSRRVLIYAILAVLAGGCARRPPRSPHPIRSRSPSASRSSARSPTSWTSPAGPRPSSRWTSARGSPATWWRCPFKEGSEVKKGDLLFEIDPRPYQAQLDQAAGPGQPLPGPAQAGQDDLRPRPGHQQHDAGRRQPAAARPGRGRRRGGRGPGQGVREEHGGLQAQPRIHQGRLADRRQVSRYYLTVGNLVNQDQTLLTTVVSLDPMYAYFDMDEPTLLRDPQGDQRGEDQAARQDGARSRS